MAAVALFMVGRLAKFNDIFTSTVPTINNFSNHALRINCLTLFVQLKIQNNILFLYTTESSKEPESSWIYNTLHGWLWTDADTFPWIWRKQDRTWNYLENPRNTADGHWLFNQSSDDWVFFEFENIWMQVNNPFTGD